MNKKYKLLKVEMLAVLQSKKLKSGKRFGFKN